MSAHASTHEQMVLAAIAELGGSPSASEVLDHLCPPVPITREQANSAIHALLVSERVDLSFEHTLSQRTR